LLAIETAGSFCSAAVTRGDVPLAAEQVALRHGHAQALLPMIARIMQRADVEPAALKAVAVATGPGGFTGIRVGLAAGHGIALATGAQLVGITSFEAAAIKARTILDKRGKGGSADLTPVLIALDSRRDDFYMQLFAGDGTPLVAPQAVTPDRLSDLIAPHIATLPNHTRLLIGGDAAEAAASALTPDARADILRGAEPDAVAVAAAAVGVLLSGAIPAPARPLYLRPPDVTAPRVAARPASVA
jgi:tRNA threonylcarbamoyladenosine biosynthesis protein TsaB